MELLNKTTRINAEALRSALQHRKGTMPRFNLPLTEEEAYNSLMVAIKVEVEYRHREFVMNDELEAQTRHLSAFLTQENSKFGIVLTGGCGNAKPPSLKPYRTSLTHFASPTHIMARNMQ